MAFEYAYSLDASAVSNIKDFPLDTTGTASTGFNIGFTGLTGGATAYYPRKGDLVFLNAGLLRKSYNLVSPKANGVIEGFEFTGLGQGPTGSQPFDYSAKNASFTADVTSTTKYANGLAKVRVETDSVYRVPLKAGQTATVAMIGGSYGIFTDTITGDQTVDNTQTVNVVVKIVDVDLKTNNVFCMMATNNTF